MSHYTLKLDPETRDIIFNADGLLETVKGDAATAQNITNTLNAMKAEFVLDETHGTDYDRVLSQDYYDISGGVAEEVYREAIFQESRVTVINSIDVSVGSRETGVAFNAELSGGAQIIKEGAEVRLGGYE